MKRPALNNFRRIVVKVGSSLLVDSAAGRVRADWLASLAEDLAGLHNERRDLMVVSSGAIATPTGDDSRGTFVHAESATTPVAKQP